MKYFLYFAPLILLLACSKSKDTDFRNDSLAGKWKLSAVAYSEGGPLVERAADPSKPVMVEFGQNGTFNSTAPGNKYNHYELLNSEDVRLTGPDATPTTLRFTISGNTLQLTPVDPMCIEGCYSKYVAIP